MAGQLLAIWQCRVLPPIPAVLGPVRQSMLLVNTKESEKVPKNNLICCTSPSCTTWLRQRWLPLLRPPSPGQAISGRTTTHCLPGWLAAKDRPAQQSGLGAHEPIRPPSLAAAIRRRRRPMSHRRQRQRAELMGGRVGETLLRRRGIIFSCFSHRRDLDPLVFAAQEPPVPEGFSIFRHHSPSPGLFENSPISHPQAMTEAASRPRRWLV